MGYAMQEWVEISIASEQLLRYATQELHTIFIPKINKIKAAKVTSWQWYIHQ